MNTPCLVLFSNSFATNIKDIFSTCEIEELNRKTDKCSNPHINRLHDLVERIEGKKYSHITIVTGDFERNLLLAKLNGTYEVICRFNNDDVAGLSFNLFDLMCAYESMKDSFVFDSLFIEDEAEECFNKNDLDDLEAIKNNIQSALDGALTKNEILLKKIVDIYESQLKV
jgi:hypothetical protein